MKRKNIKSIFEQNTYYNPNAMTPINIQNLQSNQNIPILPDPNYNTTLIQEPTQQPNNMGIGQPQQQTIFQQSSQQQPPSYPDPGSPVGMEIVPNQNIALQNSATEPNVVPGGDYTNNMFSIPPETTNLLYSDYNMQGATNIFNKDELPALNKLTNILNNFYYIDNILDQVNEKKYNVFKEKLKTSINLLITFLNNIDKYRDQLENIEGLFSNLNQSLLEELNKLLE